MFADIITCVGIIVDNDFSCWLLHNWWGRRCRIISCVGNNITRGRRRNILGNIAYSWVIRIDWGISCIGWRWRLVGRVLSGRIWRVWAVHSYSLSIGWITHWLICGICWGITHIISCCINGYSYIGLTNIGRSILSLLIITGSIWNTRIRRTWRWTTTWRISRRRWSIIGTSIIARSWITSQRIIHNCNQIKRIIRWIRINLLIRNDKSKWGWVTCCLYYQEKISFRSKKLFVSLGVN